MRKFVLFFMFLFLCFPCKTHGYEFKQINTVFNALYTDYKDTFDPENLVLSLGADALNQFDGSFKLYSSSTKAFLYKDKQLVQSFFLPSKNDPSLWKSLLIDIYESAFSLINQQDVQGLEDIFLSILMKHLDKFSRIEAQAASSVEFDYTIKDNVLYIKLSKFDKGCSEKIRHVINQHSDVFGLVLDLRGNQGGLFSEAINMADLFLDDSIITYSIEKNRQKRFYTSHTGDILSGRSIVILTDDYTASAAEIVVAALSEQSRATIIGTKTYGKGSIQQMHKIQQNTLYLTSGYFYSPSGNPINHQGIMPQICTGINDSCIYPDKSDPEKDITSAVRFIKNNLS